MVSYSSGRGILKAGKHAARGVWVLDEGFVNQDKNHANESSVGLQLQYFLTTPRLHGSRLCSVSVTCALNLDYRAALLQNSAG